MKRKTTMIGKAKRKIIAMIATVAMIATFAIPVPAFANEFQLDPSETVTSVTETSPAEPETSPAESEVVTYALPPDLPGITDPDIAIMSVKVSGKTVSGGDILYFNTALPISEIEVMPPGAVVQIYQDASDVPLSSKVTSLAVKHTYKVIVSLPGFTNTVEFTIVVDNTKPVVKVTAESDGAAYAGGSAWTGSDVDITLTLTNEASVISGYHFEFLTEEEGAEWIEIEGNTFDVDGIADAETKVSLQFRAVSNSGMVSDAKTFKVNIDKLAPQFVSQNVFITDGYDAYGKDVTFTFTETNATGTVTYNLNGEAAIREAVNVRSVKFSDNGEYTDIKIADKFGNTAEIENLVVNKVTPVAGTLAVVANYTGVNNRGPLAITVPATAAVDFAWQISTDNTNWSWLGQNANEALSYTVWPNISGDVTRYYFRAVNTLSGLVSGPRYRDSNPAGLWIKNGTYAFEATDGGNYSFKPGRVDAFETAPGVTLSFTNLKNNREVAANGALSNVVADDSTADYKVVASSSEGEIATFYFNITGNVKPALTVTATSGGSEVLKNGWAKELVKFTTTVTNYSALSGIARLEYTTDDGVTWKPAGTVNAKTGIASVNFAKPTADTNLTFKFRAIATSGEEATVTFGVIKFDVTAPLVETYAVTDLLEGYTAYSGDFVIRCQEGASEKLNISYTYTPFGEDAVAEPTTKAFTTLANYGAVFGIRLTANGTYSDIVVFDAAGNTATVGDFTISKAQNLAALTIVNDGANREITLSLSNPSGSDVTYQVQIGEGAGWTDMDGDTYIVETKTKNEGGVNTKYSFRALDSKSGVAGSVRSQTYMVSPPVVTVN